MTVYELNRAPNARRVRMFLAEKGTVGEECKQQALVWFARLDARLAELPYVAGDRFTIADILALCTIGFGKVVALRIAPHQHHLQAWHERVSARPSAQA
ncbi:glutathione binding-like protein [Aeromonas sp. OTU364]|uniref:glutathione binding-like protein n=1 Tax=Aeromonas sp. OTU364 TaxID=3043864 RepID=UPI00313EE5C2